MPDIQITTTQNVVIDFSSADAGKRIGAYFIDGAIKGLYIFLLIYLVIEIPLIQEAISASKGDIWSLIAIYGLLSLPIMFYTLLSESLMEGQTLGKKALNIQVVKIDGYQAHFFDYFIRWVLRLVDISSFSGLVALIAIGSSKKQQRLGGMASGTAVINTKNKFDISHTILQEVAKDYKPTYPSVINLSDNDVRIVMEHLEKATKNRNNIDHKTLNILQEKVVTVMKTEPAKNSTAESFLQTVIKDYNHFTGA